MINHSVFFKLKYPKGSSEERIFLNAASKLSTISVVKNFLVLDETSPKNEYEYGLKMEFESQEAYDAYNEHPHHSLFLKMYWDDYVDKFLEIDYKVIDLQ
ncbi:Dabb family protein [Algoriphagus lutimaris]|uniref:Dabb family protein n=1 Tax=Algoriphagus lutimaris TaxID=613197 RepID=UPI00196B46DD|nr:Dabb family protein [Algoriphagus lutimaris]MBN3521304.1 Dabb family protein [Algoriphagus lutimaris]